jgi:hypothetical protein
MWQNSNTWGATLTNRNDLHDEIKRECLLSFRPKCLPVSYKKLRIKTYKTVILPVVLYGCETWSLTLREERRLRVFEEQNAEEDIWT